jgi:hypothetical protein
MLWKFNCALVLLLALPGLLKAQSAAPDTPDAAAGAEIAAATTEPRFLSPWVSYLPASATVPSPRESGGVPRSSAGGGAAAAAASQFTETRTPGSHLRVSFAQPEHPIGYGYPAQTYVFRQNYALYAVPRRWLRMAYCTTCLDGPFDASGVVMEWGDRDGAPLVISGQAWGEENLIGRPAILDMPVGKGRVVAFNFNPLHRDMNRGDQRLLWNAILNWQAILSRR